MSWTPLPLDLLTEMSEVVSRTCGLHFAGARLRELERAVRITAREVGASSVPAFAAAVLASDLTQADLDAFVDQMTIGETYFHRDKNLFHALEHFVLPQLLQTARETSARARIWCAGCSTGEEPYSVAMTLRRAFSGAEAGPPRILATDINNRFLERARSGLYTEWSFRQTPTWVKELYFQPSGEGRFQISCELQDMVAFARLNLVEDVYPSHRTKTDGVNLILCRNVLMYFHEDIRAQVLRRLVASLAEGGWLIVSPSETAFLKHPELRSVRFPGFFGFQRVRAKPGNGGRARSEGRIDRSGVGLSRHAGDPVSFPVKSRTRAEAVVPEPPSPEEDGAVVNGWDQVLDTALQRFEEGRYQDVVSLLSTPTGKGGGSNGSQAMPASVPALLAKAHANLGSLQEALDWCQRSLRLAMHDPGRHLLLATIQLEMGDTDGAMASLRKALYLDPGSVMARFQMGVVCRAADRFPESDRWMRSVLTLLEDSDPDLVLPDSDGMTVQRVVELAGSLIAERSG